MSWEKFEEDCPGCRPVLLDAKTGKPFDPDHPVMKKINAVWENTTPEERQVFHRVTCNNSRDPGDLGLMRGLAERMRTALDEASWFDDEFSEFLEKQGIEPLEVSEELEGMKWRRESGKFEGLIGESPSCVVVVARAEQEYDGAITLIPKGMVVHFTRGTAKKVFLRAAEKLEAASAG